MLVTPDSSSRTPQRGVPTRPIRKRLSHDVPLWVDPAKECYFITISCRHRGRNQLALPDVAKALLETIQHRNENLVWYVHVALLMPDHLHMLVSFPQSPKRLQTILSKWKEWTAKKLGISWQRDFFEHRLRQDESFRQKANYILHNPVRAGLVATAEEWPHMFFADPQ
ncbi:MAG: REP-associated tyrosine transposase [Verrucomicrobiota bacterium]|jgi:putative transposase